MCIEVVTGNGTYDAGNLEISVNNALHPPSRKFRQGEVVLKCCDCFDNHIHTISVKGPTNDGWIGDIAVTKNGLEQKFKCIDCCGPVFNRKILVDGDGSCNESYPFAMCRDGNSCTLKIEGKK